MSYVSEVDLGNYLIGASQENRSTIVIVCFRGTLLRFWQGFEPSVKTTSKWNNSMCDNCGGWVDKL